MHTLAEYNIMVNNQFFGIITTGSIILTVCVFMVFYYIFIEQTALVRFFCYFSLASMMGLLADSFYELKRLGRDYPVSLDLLFTLEVVGEYLSLFAVYLLVLHLMRIRHRLLSVCLFAVLVSCSWAGHVTGYDELAFYAFAFLCATVVFVISYKAQRRRIMWLMFAYTVLLMLGHIPIGNGYILMNLQWMVDWGISVFLIYYFLKRYKRIRLERKHLYEKLTRDNLTKAKSKTYFMEQLKNTEAGTVIFMDINRFKWVNDSYGHLAGDALLSAFASDYTDRETMVFSRFGGDEFTVLLDTTDVKEVAAACEGFISSFRQVLTTYDDAVELGVGLSVGAASFEKGNSEDALGIADDSMYRAKRQGNNQVLYYSKGAFEWIG